MKALYIENLKFEYLKNTPILDVSLFEMQQSEKVFLFGPSGTGKTTLLEILSGVLVPDAGHVEVLGSDLTKLNAAARDRFRSENIGFIFQQFNLVPYLTVAENIRLPFVFNKKSQEPGLYARLTDVLGIAHLSDRSVTDLSVGQQQRVAVARALISKPRLILADEPTSALDYDRREQFLKILFELCDLHQTSLLFVSHDRSIEKLFDRSVDLRSMNKAAREVSL